MILAFRIFRLLPEISGRHRAGCEQTQRHYLDISLTSGDLLFFYNELSCVGRDD
ncbi:hypothetical protein LTSEWAN_0784 [Salmonella enterica subsp. enterica serovar Wandsworth str. A4-580]|uniref:Uncharacterized protein n=1 Tax=Salmonella enterica subsp. enterica serovar Wandsworth str. A4-580 TaxID=913086 RepID=G5S7I4_SALET|nr:hypothetical protein LTSEWAN_0784 [Salmonella enterica subsp. enterica serovar Wandsworth str. A4-580]